LVAVGVVMVVVVLIDCSCDAGGIGQVDMPAAGAVSAHQSVLKCPAGSRFVDLSGGTLTQSTASTHGVHRALWWSSMTAGLYGAHTGSDYYDLWSPSCNMLKSTVLFRCSPCPHQTYTVASGYSDGTSSGAVDVPCVACPVGGVCTGQTGVVRADVGFWGAIERSTNVNGYGARPRHSAVLYGCCWGCVVIHSHSRPPPCTVSLAPFLAAVAAVTGRVDLCSLCTRVQLHC
jgi:hypothetical protein